MGNINFTVAHLQIYVVIFIMMGGRGVDSQSYQNATNLISTLLSSYNTEVIPLNNQSDIIYINVSLSLYSNPKVDSTRGTISTSLVLSTQWTDELITWTPSQHYGIENVIIKNENVWKPTICIAQSLSFEPLQDSWMGIKFSSDGSAEFTPGDVYETSCTFNMKFWPFDKHACYITFYSFDYSEERLQIVARNTGISTLYYIQNGEWHLDLDSIDYKISKVGLPLITYRLIFEREPIFYLLTVILPMNGIGALNCLVFLIPRGERLGFSVTIMLSLAVFLTVVTDELPKRSDPVPIMCVYILFAVLVSMLATVMAILNLKLYERQKDVPTAAMYKWIVRISHCRRNKIEEKQDCSVHSQSVKKEPSESNGMILQNLDQNDCASITDSDIHNSNSITWQDVSKAIDNILFFMLVFMTYIPSIIILICLASASDYEKDSLYWSL